MALYKHLRPVDNSLLDPHGPLSSNIEPLVISEVNRQVTAVQEQTNKRGEYLKFSDDEKATVACYASENGVAAAIRHFKRSKGMILKESTVRDWKKAGLSRITGDRPFRHHLGHSQYPLFLLACITSAFPQ